MKFDPIKFTEKIPVDSLRRKAMDVLLTVGIPFNRWLGMRLDHLDTHKVRVISPPAVLRRNHVGSAHACSLALLGEYPAGLIVAQEYPSDKFRMIISSLNIEYSKQGRGVLYGEALAPDNWPDLIDDEGWIEMKTEITNEKAETIAICKTTWQVKSWDRIERDRTERGQSQKN